MVAWRIWKKTRRPSQRRCRRPIPRSVRPAKRRMCHRGRGAGLAIVNAPDDVDLRAVLAPLGLTGAALVLYQPAAPTRTEPGT